MPKALVAVLLVIVLVPTASAQDLARQALDDPDFDWRSLENTEARVYYKAGSFAERHRDMLLRAVSMAIEEDLEFLGESTYEPRLNVFFVDDRAEMERIVGSPVTGLANWSADAIFLVFAPDWRSFEKHEFAHIITMGVWGTPHESSRWMIEGIAIAADGWCREYSVDEIAYHYLTAGELPALSELPTGMRELGEIRGGVYAASVIAFIRSKYGPGAVRELWTKGSAVLSDTRGGTFDTIEDSWKEYLEWKVGDGVQVDMKSIDDNGCG